MTNNEFDWWFFKIILNVHVKLTSNKSRVCKTPSKLVSVILHWKRCDHLKIWDNYYKFFVLNVSENIILARLTHGSFQNTSLVIDIYLIFNLPIKHLYTMCISCFPSALGNQIILSLEIRETLETGIK